jgi:hypothetical protein
MFHKLFFGLIVILTIGLVIGCERNPIGPNDVSMVSDNVANDMGNNNEQSDAGGKFSNPIINVLKSVSLRVPWLSQAINDNDWDNNHNCGQTCVVMLLGYFKGKAVNFDAIAAQNKLLAKQFKDDRFAKSTKGWTTGSNHLSYLLGQGGLRTATCNAKNPDDMLTYVSNGKPCIAWVHIDNGNLVKAGTEHWVLVVGWDGKNVILNDSGTDRGIRRGDHIKYPLATFDASWAPDKRLYMPVW